MVIKKLKNILENIGIVDDINELTSLYDDLQMDSTEIAEFTTALTREYGISIKCMNLKNFNIGQIIELIEKKINNND